MFQANRNPDFEHELYEYYDERVDLDADRLYDPVTERRYRELLSSWQGLAPGRRLLDIGCGMGHLVRTAGAAGWEAEGIELAEGAVAVCERMGVPARRLDIGSPELDSGSFDVIAMIEVIEHVPEPAAFLHRAAGLLRPGGLLYLTTPNFDCIERRLAGGAWPVIHPEHITYFTPATLTRTLTREAGLEVLEVHTHNISVGALAGILRRSPPAGGDLSPGPEGAQPTAEDGPSPDAVLRRRLEGSSALGSLKGLANRLLDMTRAGSAMKVLAMRRR